MISPDRARPELHRRLTLPISAILLAIMGWSLGQLGAPAALGRLTFWWFFAVATFFLARGQGGTLARWWHLPRDLAIWLPLLLWLLASVALLRQAAKQRARQA